MKDLNNAIYNLQSARILLEFPSVGSSVLYRYNKDK